MKLPLPSRDAQHDRHHRTYVELIHLTRLLTRAEKPWEVPCLRRRAILIEFWLVATVADRKCFPIIQSRKRALLPVWLRGPCVYWQPKGMTLAPPGDLTCQYIHGANMPVSRWSNLCKCKRQPRICPFSQKKATWQHRPVETVATSQWGGSETIHLRLTFDVLTS